MQVVSRGWESLRKHPVESIVGYFIYGLLSIVMFIPILGMFVFLPLLGGLTILSLRIVRDENPNISDLFAGFKDYWKWIALGWIYIAAMIAAAIPTVAAILVSVFLLEPTRHGIPSNNLVSSDSLTILMVVMIALGVCATVLIAILLSIRWFFITFVAADGGGIMESYRRSAEMAKGLYLPLFLIDILSFLAIMVASSITGGLGTYFIGTIALLATAHIYMDIKALSTTAEPPTSN